MTPKLFIALCGLLMVSSCSAELQGHSRHLLEVDLNSTASSTAPNATLFVSSVVPSNTVNGVPGPCALSGDLLSNSTLNLSPIVVPVVPGQISVINLSSDKNLPTYLNETSRTASNQTQLYNGDFIAPNEAKTGLLYVQYLANTSNVAIGGNLTIIIELVKGVAGSPTVQRDPTQALPYCTLNITYEVVAPPPPPGSPPPPAASGNIQGSPLANTPQFTPVPGIPRTTGVDDGKGNRGYANQGSLNIGNDNTGNCNQGDGNTGNNNIGSGNHGDCNQGYGNIGNGLVGNGLKGSGPNVGCACQVTASGGK